MDVETARLINHICGSPYWSLLAILGIISFVLIFIVKGKRKAIPIAITCVCGVVFATINILCMYTYTLIPEPAPQWIDQHPFALTDPGRVTYKTCASNDAGEEKEVEIEADVSISEAVSETREGYKEVTATYVCDLKNVEEGFRLNQWMSAFDLNSGTSFEFGSDSASEEEVHSGNTVFNYFGKPVDVNMEYGIDYDKDGRILTVTIKVTCPKDYNGTVFQLGYADKKITEENNRIDHKARLYTIDELPGYDTNGHTYYYFASWKR